MRRRVRFVLLFLLLFLLVGSPRGDVNEIEKGDGDTCRKKKIYLAEEKEVYFARDEKKKNDIKEGRGS